MPNIVIMDRQDRQGDVPVSVTTGKIEQRQTIKRGKPTAVSDEIFDTLMSSHEADYVQVMAEEPVPDDEVRSTQAGGMEEPKHRGRGRPRKWDLEA